jgi:hypothetical protein
MKLIILDGAQAELEERRPTTGNTPHPPLPLPWWRITNMARSDCSSIR